MAEQDIPWPWFAIRTKPGSQMPKREYWAEPSESALAPGKTRGKGYRIASSANPEMSAIEMALAAKKITHYMPAEFSVVRNRNHKGLYELRRFALMKGYVFVTELEDRQWSMLMDMPDVQGVVSNAGKPFPIDPLDLHKLRMYERNSRAEAQKEADKLSAANDRLGREQRKVIVRGARKKLFPGRSVRLIWGKKVGREATVQGWTDQDQVRVLLQSLDEAEVATFPYEFLKAAE